MFVVSEIVLRWLIFSCKVTGVIVRVCIVRDKLVRKRIFMNYILHCTQKHRVVLLLICYTFLTAEKTIHRIVFFFNLLQFYYIC